MTAENKIDIKDQWAWLQQHFAVLFITAVMTFVISNGTMYFAYVRGLQKQNTSLMLEMNAQARAHSEEISVMRVNLARLEMQLQGMFDETPEATLIRVLNGLPVPAWCNQYIPSEDKFRMFHVNPDYEVEYGKSLARYRGRTHYQVWPEDIAKVFDEGDRRVYATGSGEVVLEPFSQDLSQIRTYLKWFHESRNGLELVCAAEIEVDGQGVSQ
jgi:hypothetical protein